MMSSGVGDAVTAPLCAEAHTPEPAGGPQRFRAWVRRWGFPVEVLLAMLVGLVAVLRAEANATAALAALLVWAVLSYRVGNTASTPLPLQLRHLVESTLFPLAGLALAVVFLGVPDWTVVPASTAVVSAGIAAALSRFARWHLQSALRVLLVGDRVAIAYAVARWMRSDRVQPVAALLVEPDLDVAPTEIMGIPVVTALADAPDVVRSFAVDQVIVSPAPGLTSIDLRRLAWQLERTRAGLGVLGILDSVGPHRITPGMVEGATVNDVRLPRPSVPVSVVKSMVDRLAAVVLLMLVAPVLLLMSIAVRVDSRGKAFFTQTRVGRNGMLFRVYKMRTMVENAESVKLDLADQNEYDGLLFKMKADPRITRVGALLRKTSLDELPQLINVLRGEMSLVGPRPSLPSEVEAMDSDTLRRLTVKPGITGLWQVSGRSDLSWDEASALDTYYADNWSLTGDLSILARTVGAVLAARGAY